MSPLNPKQRWKNLLVLAFGNMIDTADGGLINALFPAIRTALHMNLETLGQFTAIGRLARMLFGPLWAMAADFWNRKLLMFIVTGIWGIWTILAGLAQNQTELMILYAIGAIGSVAAEPLTTAIAADLFPPGERGKAFGALRALGGFGFLVFAPLIGLFSRSPEGWRWAMFTMGGLSVLSGIIILIFLRDPGRGASESEGSIIKLPKKGQLMLIFRSPTVLLMATSMIFVTSLVLFSYAVTFLVDVRGFTNAEGTYVLAIYAGGFIASSLIGGLLGDWAARKNPRWGRIILMQLYLVAFSLMSFLSLQIAWSHWAYYLLFFLFGLVSAIGFPGAVIPLLSAVVLPERRATAFGFVFSFVQGIVATALSLAVGWLAQRYGLRSVVFWVTTVPYAFNALFWFAFYGIVPKEMAKIRVELASRREAIKPDPIA